MFQIEGHTLLSVICFIVALMFLAAAIYFRKKPIQVIYFSSLCVVANLGAFLLRIHEHIPGIITAILCAILFILIELKKKREEALQEEP